MVEDISSLENITICVKLDRELLSSNIQSETEPEADPAESTALQTGPLLLVEILCSYWLDYMLLTPALLCHKDTAPDTQIPLLGAFLAFRCVSIA